MPNENFESGKSLDAQQWHEVQPGSFSQFSADTLVGDQFVVPQLMRYKLQGLTQIHNDPWQRRWRLNRLFFND